ncbi:MAG TPA: DUF3618 domain-containing protein [Thermomicrobiales bacterium]|nr:DUF3618 domain-containing protein [Thermomicrobiales bacterium]
MGQSSDQIREEIDRTRDSAAGKIDQLQDQVRGTADEMRAQVQGTAQDVVDQVKGTVDHTIESVKENMDLRQQIEQRPLLALGAALVGGFVLGGMMGDGGHQHSGHRREFSSGTPVGESAHGSMSGFRSAVQRSGLEETISNAAAAFMGNITEQLKGTIDQNFPGFADKMKTAQGSSGSFADKTRAATSTST